MDFGPTIFYGSLSLLTLLNTVLARQQAAVWVAMVLLADWLYWNTVVICFGFAYAPFLLPVGDAMFLGFTVWIWRDSQRRSESVAMVAYLYLVAIIAWATFGVTGTQNSFLCYLTANLIFLLQLVVLGAASAWRAISERMAGLPWPGPLRLGGGPKSRRVHGVGRAPHPNGS